MIFGARISYEGPDGNTLILDSDEGTRTLPITDDALGELDRALNPFREHMAEGEAVRQEYEAAGGVSWDAYQNACASTDPEGDWFEMLRNQVDFSRKVRRERGEAA